jgi:diguanylate cyclase (GGDEF)-like protein/PAS domain S-box-containing protein
MSERTELLEAALEGYPDGIGLLGEEGLVRLWNPSAEAMTGFPSVELLGRPLPEQLEPLMHFLSQPSGDLLGDRTRLGIGSLVQARHKLGHPLPLIARIQVLRSGLGSRIGTALVFHPAENLDALPHGEAGDNQAVQTSQTELDERLKATYEDLLRGGSSFGLLWITVDQANALRKTHGARACEAMLEKMAIALIHGMRPAEEIGRWGEDEFLIISHERSPEALSAHAQSLTGLARTADFRWWGDRVSLTVSIGAAQAEPSESLAQLLGRAQAAMFSSVHAGGNQITSSSGGQACLPS